MMDEPRVILACSADRHYYTAIRPYLETLSANSRSENVLVAVNDDPPALPVNVRGVRADTTSMRYQPPLNHPQSGGFLESIPGTPGDVIIFTDGDIKFQRRFSQQEWEWITSWQPGVVGVSFNSGPDETLYDEALRIQPKTIVLPMDIPTLRSIHCYNTGVIVALRSTWERWYAKTAELWPTVDATFNHYARQQWAMCWAIHELKLAVSVLPYTFHLHGCYTPPPGMGMDVADGSITYEGAPVLFRHHL